MSSSTTNNMTETSDRYPPDEAMDVDGAYKRMRFEDLLDESTSDEDDSAEPETTEKDKSVNQSSSDVNINESGASNSTGANNKMPIDRSDDDSDEIILSLIWMKGHLGAAYYNVHTSELFVMDDMEDDTQYGITKTLYRECQPRWVVTTTGSPDQFLDVIKKLIVADTMTQNDGTSMSSIASGPIRVSLKFLPKKDNSYEHCYHRVLCLKLNNEPKGASNAERRIFLNSLLNFNDRLMIHALGLLLKYLDANWNKLTLDSNGHAEFVHLNYVLLKDLIMMDDDTYKVLGIIQSRFHPSLAKFGKQASKDKGISLFTLLNRCRSRPGVHYLWKLMRHPTRDISILNERFAAIRFFLDPNNQNVAESLGSCFDNMYRLNSNILNRYSAPHAKIADWVKLYKTLTQVICVGDICANYQNDVKLFGKIVNSITPEFHIMRYFIDYIVDFDMSKVHGKLVVKSGVDAALDELKHTREKLPQILTEAAEKDMRNYKLMEGCRMLYLPNIGHVLAITGWEGAPAGELDVPGLEFKFTIRGVRHYKSEAARELDETVGDVWRHITKLQSQIILRLVRYMSRHVGPLLKTIEYCAELDTLLSFATAARDYGYVMPEVVKSKIIAIKRGRHPLKELLTNFVPNDTLSKPESSLVKILTGPNASGKSVYLKQVALIVFMAHIGSFVPAESATIGTVTHILTQIDTVDSLAQNASSFLLALRQINVAYRASTANSLVIIDEFGAGTSEIDGLALLTAVLQRFLERGINCPHIFAATHIHRVIELLPKNLAFEAQTFEFVSNDNNGPVFLHQLITGNTTCSFAHAVAQNAGLDADIIQRALEVFKHKKRNDLPPPLPNTKRERAIIHVIELLSTPGRKVDLNELSMWLRQVNDNPAPNNKLPDKGN